MTITTMSKINLISTSTTIFCIYIAQKKLVFVVTKFLIFHFTVQSNKKKFCLLKKKNYYQQQKIVNKNINNIINFN